MIRKSDLKKRKTTLTETTITDVINGDDRGVRIRRGYTEFVLNYMSEDINRYDKSKLRLPTINEMRIIKDHYEEINNRIYRLGGPRMGETLQYPVTIGDDIVGYEIETGMISNKFDNPITRTIFKDL